MRSYDVVYAGGWYVAYLCYRGKRMPTYSAVFSDRQDAEDWATDWCDGTW